MPATFTLANTQAGAAHGRYAGIALSAIAGQAAAETLIERLRDGTAQPTDLATLLRDLGHDEFGGACNAIAKTLAASIEN